MNISSEERTSWAALFFAAGAAITSGAMMVHLKKDYRGLLNGGTLTCPTTGSGATTNCSLQGAYGDGVLAVNIISVVLNGILFIFMLSKWMKERQRVLSGMVRATFYIVSCSILFAVAASGYNLYLQHNFGKKLNTGAFGTGCSITTACAELGGKEGKIIDGLDITMIVLSSLALLMHSLMVTRANERMGGGLLPRSMSRI